MVRLNLTAHTLRMHVVMEDVMQAELATCVQFRLRPHPCMWAVRQKPHLHRLLLHFGTRDIDVVLLTTINGRDHNDYTSILITGNKL